MSNYKVYQWAPIQYDRGNQDNLSYTNKFIVEEIKEQLLVHEHYTTKIIITDIQKRFWVVVSYRQAYLAHEIALNQVHGDFDRSYGELIPLRELKVNNYETTIL